jgi:hypothetical protein
MRYARPHVRQALSAAREAGKPVDGLHVGDRETELVLERMGFLPVDVDAVDAKIAGWYAAQGLAMRVDEPVPVSPVPIDTRGDTPGDTPGDTRGSSSTIAALAAAEAAIEAARAAIAAARAMGESAA